MILSRIINWELSSRVYWKKWIHNRKSFVCWFVKNHLGTRWELYTLLGNRFSFLLLVHSVMMERSLKSQWSPWTFLKRWDVLLLFIAQKFAETLFFMLLCVSFFILRFEFIVPKSQCVCRIDIPHKSPNIQTFERLAN